MSTLHKHIGSYVLIAAVLVVLIGMWQLPVLIMGYPYEIPSTSLAQNFAENGRFILYDDIGRLPASHLIDDSLMSSAVDGRVSAWIVSVFSPHDILGLAQITSAFFALALFFLWLTLRKVWNTTIATIAIILTGLFPAYAREAVLLSNYTFGFLFCFAAMAAYVHLKMDYPKLALISFGVLYGLSCGSKDVFLLFLPWIFVCIAYEMRSNIKRATCSICALGLLIVVTYCIPYAGDIMEYGYPVNTNLARIWPGADTVANQTYLHLYPDPYTYYFNKDAFDSQYLQSRKDAGFLEQMDTEKEVLGYDLEGSVFRSLRLGSWLLLKTLPTFFQRHNLGGFFMWIFILPGMFLLWRQDKKYALYLLGSVVSMYIIIRFVLGYERDHFVNIGWIFALCATFGMQHIAALVTSSQKHMRYMVVLVALTCIVALQLLQGIRFETARYYRETHAEHILHIAHQLESAPPDAVIALPVAAADWLTLHSLTKRTLALFAPETVSDLLKTGSLSQAFGTYDITHVYGYDEDITAIMIQNIPDLITIEPSAQPNRPVSSGLGFFLNIIR